MSDTPAHPYEKLTPDLVMDSVEQVVKRYSDGRIFPLNSYENRVYQVGMEDDDPLIVKFYRPHRWTDESILEEHQFLKALSNHELSVVAPVSFNAQTLHAVEGFRMAVFRRQGGHAPEADDMDTLYQIGTHLGRLHEIGKQIQFEHRPVMSVEKWGYQNRLFLLENDWLPRSLAPAYDTLSSDCLLMIDQLWRQCEFVPQSLHGDCHIGNILWRDEIPYFVDFDDCCTGPAVQDLWLLLPGDRSGEDHLKRAACQELIEGYETFCEFDVRELQLIEALRTLRMMNYSAWLARRWEDPAFPMHFPWFNTERYWSEHILALREQFAALQEPPLRLQP